MALNSKSKGKVGELELAKILQGYGYTVSRTNQFCGNTGEASDLVGLDNIHIECKRVERLDISKAMKQAENDAEKAGKEEWPTVFHRKNGEGWYVTMRLDDWQKIYSAWFVLGTRDIEL
jgi:Holliday junction resolvase